jgi:hypothetical protein
VEDITTTWAGHEMLFLRNGAPDHRAKSTTQFIRQKINRVDDWPANSPDLLVIENVSGKMQHKIAARRPTSIGELKKCRCEESDAQDQATLDELVRRARLSMLPKGR